MCTQLKAMTLTTKFRKELSILQDAVNNDIFLDIKYPKLYKKICRHYQNDIEWSIEDPEFDYHQVIEYLRQDLVEV